MYSTFFFLGATIYEKELGSVLQWAWNQNSVLPEAFAKNCHLNSETHFIKSSLPQLRDFYFAIWLKEAFLDKTNSKIDYSDSSIAWATSRRIAQIGTRSHRGNSISFQSRAKEEEDHLLLLLFSRLRRLLVGWRPVTFYSPNIASKYSRLSYSK